MTAQIICGDCREVMATLEECSVDAVICDPPYGLKFMGKGWDHGVPGEEFWAAVKRVTKPGAHLLAFGGTRTFHRLTCAIEDAGWEIRDCLMWLYGCGFPKSLNLGPLGTALKPAWEPIILARKPLVGTVGANVFKHGTGAINVDACRIETAESTARESTAEMGFGGGNLPAKYSTGSGIGRWPANLVHDGSAEVVAMFPESDGQAAEVGPEHGPKPSVNTFGDFGPRETFAPRGDVGSAARFFFSGKATRADREEGLEAFAIRSGGECTDRQDGTAGLNSPRAGAGRNGGRANDHPTVKTTSLMRWLCRLITPPGGLVLDPFCGSGSTGKAALLERLRFIGIDESQHYCDIATARCAWAEAHREPEQLSLLEQAI